MFDKASRALLYIGSPLLINQQASEASNRNIEIESFSNRIGPSRAQIGIMHRASNIEIMVSNRNRIEITAHRIEIEIESKFTQEPQTLYSRRPSFLK